MLIKGELKMSVTKRTRDIVTEVQEAPQFQFVVNEAEQPQVEAEEQVEKRNYRFHPGTKTKMEIKRLQKNDDLLLQKKPLQELIRDIAAISNDGNTIRVSAEAFKLIQVTLERFMVQFFTDVNKVTVNRKELTITPKDLNLVIDVRRLSTGILSNLVRDLEKEVDADAEEADDIEEVDDIVQEDESSSE